MARQELVEHFIKYPGNLDTGAGKLLRHLSKKFFNVDKQEIYDAKKEARTKIKTVNWAIDPISIKHGDLVSINHKVGIAVNPFASFDKTVSGEVKYNLPIIDTDKFIKDWETSLEIENRNLQYLKEDLVEEGKKYYQGFGYKKEEPKIIENVLVIGDLHAPFIREGYLEFCESIYYKYGCNKVVFIGDCIDSHFSSFHEIDPDGHSAGEELRLARLQLKDWHKAFPNAFVCIGNHDRIPDRKRFNAGLSKQWLRKISDVLETPTWTFDEEFIFDDVRYCHGESRSAESRMLQDQMSVVQGHWHSKSYITNNVGKKAKTFAMQVGCGIDDKAYAFAYGKLFPKSHINCGVVLENGTLPILEYMNLNK